MSDLHHFKLTVGENGWPKLEMDGKLLQAGKIELVAEGGGRWPKIRVELPVALMDFDGYAEAALSLPVRLKPEGGAAEDADSEDVEP